MVFAYNFFFFLFAVFALPVYIARGKINAEFLRRFWRSPAECPLKNPLWVHAVSVGEAIMMKPLIEKLRGLPGTQGIVISTVTATGNQVVKRMAAVSDYVAYLPLDFSGCVNRALDHIAPRIFIIAETELWPNLITALWRRRVPVLVVNARISDKSFKGYRLFRGVMKLLCNRVTFFLVQTARDAERLQALGVAKEKVRVTGNMKFDFTGSEVRRNCREQLALKAQDMLFVCGSTHPGEEETVVAVFKKMRAQYPLLRLLIAARHPERAGEVSQIILAAGLRPFLLSALGTVSTYDSPDAVYVLDTVGELVSWYAAADIVFVGGSLVKKGGHNILEPALFGKPVLFGPHMFNFRDIAEQFIRKNAGIMVQNGDELLLKGLELAGSPSKARALGENARGLIAENQGAAERNFNIIKQVLNGSALL